MNRLSTPAPVGQHPGIRMRTIVAGLVALTISATILLDALTGIDIDGGLVALAVLIGAGVLLLASGIMAAVREQRQAQQQSDPYQQPYQRP
jgi:hypothetical protein